MYVPSSEFDWDGSDALVVPEQPAIAVFVNNGGEVVVRQKCTDDDGDVYVLIQPENARLVALAIMEAAKLSAACFDDDPCPIPAQSSSAAERQRRYRQRKRDANTVTRDGPSVTRDAAE
jgi:hypothetical protein